MLVLKSTPGGDDVPKVLPPSALARVGLAMRRHQRVILGAGHMDLLDHPDVAAQLRAWLAAG